jgi:hypothetical protein
MQGTYDPKTHYWRKLGIYSYTADFLPKFITMPASGLQKAEDLEQNKVIEAGFKIKVGKVEDAVHGVDTPEQLDELNALIGTCHRCSPPDSLSERRPTQARACREKGVAPISLWLRAGGG